MVCQFHIARNLMEENARRRAERNSRPMGRFSGRGLQGGRGGSEAYDKAPGLEQQQEGGLRGLDQVGASAFEGEHDKIISVNAGGKGGGTKHWAFGGL
jgi:hypothetical protein